MLIAEVLLDRSAAKSFDYEVPEELRDLIQVGIRVEIPFRDAMKQGTVSHLKTGTEQKVKPIARILSGNSLPEPLWKLAQWMSLYYCCPLHRVLDCLTPPAIRREVKPQKILLAMLNITHKEALDLCGQWRVNRPQQAALLELLLNAKRAPRVADLLKTTGLTRGKLLTLVKQKIIRCDAAEDNSSLEDVEFFPTVAKQLTEEQAVCLEKISADVQKNEFAAHLVHGVTGSGKTEIYLQTIQKALDLGKSALLLVPEIALTSQTIERFRARFGLKLAILHHRRSHGERQAAWEGLKSGEVRIAIGARSAIFCPAKQLGLIIIDEEHDNSYKQHEEMPTYHARDVALMRAKLEGAVVVLGSATPSLESLHNCMKGKYQLSKLTKRATKASMPSVRIVDMKMAMERQGGFSHFSSELLDALKDRCDKGEQTLLLLNRRGTHRMQLCLSCKTCIRCPHCDLTLTFHRTEHILRCHLCDHRAQPYKECPSCKSTASMEFKGFGTEHVERSLHAVFPSVRTLRMDRDTTREKESHEELFKQFRSHKADVLIGTQMIAKGFHFPSVTLVGVLQADASLQIPDFRAQETVFQLISQVAGRAGRAELPGEVILQTFMPDHPLIKLAASQDFDLFAKAELEERKMFSFPPFCKLIKLVLISKDEMLAANAAAKIREELLSLAPAESQFLPVLPAGHAKVKDLYRFQFLIKTPSIQPFSRALLKLRAEMPRSLALLIDVDPLSTFF